MLRAVLALFLVTLMVAGGFAVAGRRTVTLAVPVAGSHQGWFCGRSIGADHALGLIDDGKEAALVEEYRRKLGIKMASPGQEIVNLSGGNQQKVVLARWHALNQPVLVLEEPTAGVDVGAKRQIYELLRQRADAGGALVVVSTDVEEVANVCTRVLVFRQGRVAAELSGTAITIANLLAVAAGSVTFFDKAAA